MKKIIDLENHPRRSHFEYFGSLAYPYMGMTANVDVTNAVRFAREQGGSSFHAVLWLVSTAANAVPELRQRIENGGIVEYDHCDVGHTVALPDRTFCNCSTDCRRSAAEFLPYAKKCQEEAMKHPGFVNQEEDESGMIFTSCVPWVQFTQVIQPTPIPADSNPRIVMGKYFKEGEKTMMPLHIQCNHALVDGWHVGEFYRIFAELEEAL